MLSEDHVTLKTGEMMQIIRLWSQELITFYNKFKQKSAILNFNNISQFSSFYCIFDQIKTALVSKRALFKKIV